MASGLLSKYNVVPGVVIFLTIYDDGVKAEVEQYLQRKPIGWFLDEVSAISAAVERSIMRSAILPELRRLPKISVCSEYRREPCGREVRRYGRGTVSKHGPLGRRVVLLPCAMDKPWLAG